MDAGHFVFLIMRSDQENLLFASPIRNPRQILDIGTGPGMRPNRKPVTLPALLTNLFRLLQEHGLSTQRTNSRMQSFMAWTYSHLLIPGCHPIAFWRWKMLGKNGHGSRNST